MSDDLIKRLRKITQSGKPTHVSKADRLAAADRIEALEAQLREARMQSLSDLGQADEAYQAQLAAEAKLAKAMQHVADYSNDPHLVEWANAALAELRSVSFANTKGETDD